MRSPLTDFLAEVNKLGLEDRLAHTVMGSERE